MSALLPKRFGSLFAVLMFSACLLAEDPKLSGLLERTPSRANAAGYLHLPSLKKLMAAADIPSQLSDNVEDVWLIADMDPIGLTPKWEAGYATLRQPVPAEGLASSIGGYVDKVADTEVVWSPRQMYLVPGKEAKLGFLRPANRPLLADWLSPGLAAQPAPYLVQQAKRPEQYLSLMFAMQVQDILSPAPLAKRLESFTSLKANRPESVARILASVRGVSVIVGRRSLAECILSIEFNKSPASLRPIANELLKEILDRNGTAAPEVLSWTVKVEENTMNFQGPISEASLEGVLNLFSIRAEAEQVADSMGKERMQLDTSKGPNGYQTKAYFDQVQSVVQRVRKHEAQTPGARAKWNDQHARKIDELGTLNVDPQMVAYSADVSSLLRNNALTMRTTSIKAGQVKAGQELSQGVSVYGGGGYGYGGGYDYYDPNSSADYQRVIDAQARGAGYMDYRSMLTTVDKLTAEIRRAMTEKFNLQF